MRQSTINSWDYMNLLWNKWIIKRIYCAIHTLTWIRLAHHRWKKNFIDGFYLFFKSRYLKYPKYLESNSKSEFSISNEMGQHVFISAVGSYVFIFFSDTYLVYIFLLLVCGNYPLTSKRGRCRNLLSIDCQLNRINPSTNIILLPHA